MKDQRKATEIAAERMQLIAPLLADGLDTAKASQIKQSICEQMGISERTLRRYLNRYRTGGFDGLKPKSKGRSSTKEAVPNHLLEQAIPET
ncbi:hypothetical protein GCM10008967_28240 [Bacillus carboniphilus]|uniref:Insertion element IS150 protein InsJ-like helix-turn-helix domain-containing protein n=1 Tax=Bacillus carboniphilus TaxID=86663 RepID=A0ABP3G907_9BACI